ncbi:RDD family protein [Thermoproteota archaeon]
MAYCKYCGAPKEEADVFCSKCGKSFEGTVNVTISQSDIGFQYATLGERFFAVLVDMILVGIITGIVMVPLGLIALMGSAMSGSPFGWFMGPSQGLSFLGWILYFTYFESTSGQTIGKRMMGIKVVDESGGSVDGGRILVRNVLRIIDWLPFLYIIGIILLSTSSGKQRLGDIVAKTVVVKA